MKKEIILFSLLFAFFIGGVSASDGMNPQTAREEWMQLQVQNGRDFKKMPMTPWETKWYNEDPQSLLQFSQGKRS